ncbi:small acid-soluble spore protein P (minor) [Anaerospora hongkongensis]|uniref:Small acid-soluble spore protein P (Minor) n=1 Tax=Anaerospora hongkongensis TaxID=244830 RepID=A0A4R1Q0B9_9FIRM|nr:small acid-soluble spore protein P [Anaerospora hongkongensis]TCL36753.1 small acid-soluble spore protein P (minor) [Anaerospora hongkongensis]
MSKPEAYPVDLPESPKREKNDDSSLTEPLSGSKKVKNRNHTGHRHGEGS